MTVCRPFGNIFVVLGILVTMKTNLSGMQLKAGFQIATVTAVHQGFAFAKYMKDFVRIESGSGYNIVAGKDLPEFGDEYAVPKVGDSVVVIVKEVTGGWIAIAWGLYTELKAAQAAIKARTECPKPAPAPATPQPVMTAAAVARGRVGRGFPSINRNGASADRSATPVMV